MDYTRDYTRENTWDYTWDYTRESKNGLGRARPIGPSGPQLRIKAWDLNNDRRRSASTSRSTGTLAAPDDVSPPMSDG
jgi:hypothetical protein